MLVGRLASGIVDHFPVRVSEWITTAAILGLASVFWSQPRTFSSSPSFTIMAQWDERTWAAICFAIALIRFAALVVNGTFRDVFAYSPHLRALASVAACVFWGKLIEGFALSALAAGGSWTGVIMYGMAMALDCWNLVRAWADVGSQHRRGNG